MKYDSQRKTPSPSSALAALLSLTDGRPAGASLYLSPSTTLLFWALYVQTKGPERAVGGQFGLACAVSDELEPVAVVVAKRAVVSLAPLIKLALFLD